ncbi:MAG TPA: hypothetical protein VMU82_01295 [Acetobacteraceae bacterium]|nr:hypothetical protein [Acetobacteraceae bacterium]
MNHLPAGTGPSSRIVGHLDGLEADVLRGWVHDPADPASPVVLVVLIDGQRVDTITCADPRPDVQAAGFPSAAVGFAYTIPHRFQEGRHHALTLQSRLGEPLLLSGGGWRKDGSLHLCLTRPSHIEGYVDGFEDGAIRGWVVRTDALTGARFGGVQVLVSTAGRPLQQVCADQFRGDVADALDCDGNCGFAITLPADAAAGQRLDLDFHAMPERQALTGSPISLAVPATGAQAQLAALAADVDRLFSHAWRMRRQLKALLPAPVHPLETYGSWAAEALPHARARAVAAYGALPANGAQHPLVSVVCRVGRPALLDFIAAAASVRGQTYAEWELLLLPEGTPDAAVAGQMQALAAADPRIRILAGTADMAAVRGAFITFLGDADLLEPAALEIMIAAARHSGAALLYSDEDTLGTKGLTRNKRIGGWESGRDPY